MAEVRVGVDTGGTFTDFLAFSDDGSLRASKTPSTPADDTEAFLTGLSNLREAGVEPGDVTSLNYGTTVALNAVLQKRWPPLGLIVTEGYRELIEIARQTVPGDWGAIYSWIKPPRVVPLENVQEARERITHKGEVVEGLNEDDIRAAATFYKEKEIGAVAICLMHSYRNAIHEQRARDVFREVHPDCFLTISSDVLPEFREYERAMTTCLNAALMPLVSDYLDHLEVRLKAANYEAPLLLMRSSGGLASANQVIEQPATIAYSGPSAGVLGMAWLARQIGEDKVLTYDMGGTSTDVALVENGEPLLTTEGFLDIYPMGTPSIDLVSIGAGGGSIAMLGTGDRLRVGPESAGADPGPVCYGKGGAAPTVTDANLVLGRIPGFLLGGQMPLDVEAAREVMAITGAKLGLEVREFAHGILQLAAASMAGAVRQVSVARGRDPREYSLFAYGGAGPLHAADLADLLGITKIVIPPNPGLGSCLGLLAADIHSAAVQTIAARADVVESDQLVATFAELEERVTTNVVSQGIDESAVITERFADLCYVGQATELTVAVPDGAVDATSLASALDVFHAEHNRVYGYDYAGEQSVEIVNLRVRGTGPLRPIELTRPEAATGAVTDAVTGERDVYFGPNDGEQATTLYDRDLLAPGHEFTGPAIVTEYDSTILVPPDSTALVDELGNLIITRSAH
ncbi:MAG: hydantoinase/oxoprolinase family protein [Acidimicrobiales bacterium]